MKSRRAPQFNKSLARLPAHARELAEQKFLLWRDNPGHPSLKFKEWKPGHWSVRVGDHYRALGIERPDGAILWTWIGTHESYNHLL